MSLKMAQNFPLVMRIMSSSIKIAEKAGEIIRKIMAEGELNVVDKGNTSFDPQTEADRQAQQLIIGSLLNQFKNLKVIGEEGVTDVSQIPKHLIIDQYCQNFLDQHKCPKSFENISESDIDQFVIWVDPLDGTSEYVLGMVENVTVLIGIAFQETSIGGIVHQPFYKCPETNKIGRTIWGLKELGTGGFVKKNAPENKLILTTTRSHSNEIVNSTIEALKPDEVLRVGGCGFKVLQLLEGNAHCYVFASAGCKKWDTCSVEAILEAEGGVLTDIGGKHYTYGSDVEHLNRTGVLATAPGICHKSLLEKIPKSVIESLSKKK